MRVTAETIRLAIKITTGGDPKISPYRIAAWLTGQGAWSPFMMAEIREFLGQSANDIDPEVGAGITTMLDEQPMWKKTRERRSKGA